MNAFFSVPLIFSICILLVVNVFSAFVLTQLLNYLTIVNLVFLFVTALITKVFGALIHSPYGYTYPEMLPQRIQY